MLKHVLRDWCPKVSRTLQEMSNGSQKCGWGCVAGVVLRCPEVSRVVTVGQDVGGVWECLSMSESVCWFSAGVYWTHTSKKRKRRRLFVSSEKLAEKARKSR